MSCGEEKWKKKSVKVSQRKKRSEEGIWASPEVMWVKPQIFMGENRGEVYFEVLYSWQSSANCGIKERNNPAGESQQKRSKKTGNASSKWIINTHQGKVSRKGRVNKITFLGYLILGIFPFRHPGPGAGGCSALEPQQGQPTALGTSCFLWGFF